MSILFSKSFINYKKRLIVFIVFFSFIKISTVYSQNFNYSLNSIANIGFVYQNESDFDIDKVQNAAIRLEISGTNKKIMVEAKIIPTLNYSFSRLTDNMFGLKLRNTNQKVSNNFFNLNLLSINDKNILTHNINSNNPRNAFYEYDLVVKPIGYEVEPGEYFYSIIFTLTQQ